MSRGRKPPDVGVYCCTGCAYHKPTIRDGGHVNCSQPGCGAAPNSQLAQSVEVAKLASRVRLERNDLGDHEVVCELRALVKDRLDWYTRRARERRSAGPWIAKARKALGFSEDSDRG